jgi:hypothetical protein
LTANSTAGISRAVRTVVGLCALLAPAAASAQDLDALVAELDRVLQREVVPVLADVTTIIEDGPVYLAKRLPAIQPLGDPGAVMDLATWGDFSVSLGVVGGILQSFNSEVASSFQTLPRTLPEPLPVPQAMLAVRAALSPDLEVGVRFGIVPNFEVESQEWQVETSTRTFAGRARYRLMQGHGARPTLVSVADLSYFTGFMQVGRDLTLDIATLDTLFDPAQYEQFRQLINAEYGQVLDPGEKVALGVFFFGAPILGWDIVQLSLEQRAVWDLGFFHPYLGVGVDLATGHVDSGVDLESDLRVTRPKDFVERVGSFREAILPRQDLTLKTVEPRSVGARGIAGFELALSEGLTVATEGQADLTSDTFAVGLAVRYAFR